MTSNIIYYNNKFPGWIRAGITTKNFGDFKIEDTYTKLAGELNESKTDIFNLQQKHTDIIHKINNTSISSVVGDGLITNKAHKILLIKTADCVPLLAYDIKKRMILAFHLGFIGVKNSYIKTGIKKMTDLGCQVKNIHIHLGPHIENKCYIFNLKKLLISDLLNLGILRHNINVVDECTYCLTERYFSHRRGDKARMATFISMI